VYSTPVPTPASTSTYTFGCWNLEHFHNSSKRGFPEYLRSGPKYDPRTENDLVLIADVITTKIGAELLVLNEINGKTEMVDEDTVTYSDELDALLEKLPDTWSYTLSSSGKKMHVAILYDTAKVHLNEVTEFEVPRIEIDGKDIFDRDPFVAHVSMLQNGQALNDLIVVGLHLASGQGNDDNHDAAMLKLLALLNEARSDGLLGGVSENDIIIMGDLNANMFRPPVEEFFLDMDAEDGGFDVLADGNYPATRLSGVPLKQDKSQIDYIIVSRFNTAGQGFRGRK